MCRMACPYLRHGLGKRGCKNEKKSFVLEYSPLSLISLGHAVGRDRPCSFRLQISEKMKTHSSQYIWLSLVTAPAGSADSSRVKIFWSETGRVWHGLRTIRPVHQCPREAFFQSFNRKSPTTWFWARLLHLFLSTARTTHAVPRPVIRCT